MTSHGNAADTFQRRTIEEWNRCNKKDLVALCDQLHITKSGTKADISVRLHAHFNPPTSTSAVINVVHDEDGYNSQSDDDDRDNIPPTTTTESTVPWGLNSLERTQAARQLLNLGAPAGLPVDLQTQQNGDLTGGARRAPAVLPRNPLSNGDPTGRTQPAAQPNNTNSLLHDLLAKVTEISDNKAEQEARVNALQSEVASLKRRTPPSPSLPPVKRRAILKQGRSLTSTEYTCDDPEQLG